LGALSAMALAQSQSVVTLPLKAPPAKTEKAKPKTEAATETVASAPAHEPLSPQAIIEIPPPEFTSKPLFPDGVPIGTDTVPTPDFVVIEAEQKPATTTKLVTEEPPPIEERRSAEPPLMMPRPKPDAPAVVMQAEPVPLAAAPPEPAQKAADAKQPAATPQPALTKTAPAPATGKRPLRRGEMEPIDDYRPPSVVVDTKALDRTLVRGPEKAAQTPPPQPKPAAPVKKSETKPAPGEMMPIDDIPGGKSYKAPRGQAATFRCFVRDVMAFYDRTHIRCYNKAKSKLNFFAVDTSQPISESLVAKGLAAMKSGKPATVTFAPEADLNPSNCAAANCRRLIDIQN
jgi:hypothetical protein